MERQDESLAPYEEGQEGSPSGPPCSEDSSATPESWESLHVVDTRHCSRCMIADIMACVPDVGVVKQPCVDHIDPFGCIHIKALGKGGCATVDLVTCVVDGQEVRAARKLIPKEVDLLADEIHRDIFINEHRAMRALQANPFVCNVLAASDSSTPGSFTLLLEHCGQGSLYDLLEAAAAKMHYTDAQLCLPLDVIQYLAACVLSGLCDLHDLNALHRDIKPDNILIAESGRAVLGDLGCCEFLDPSGVTYGGIGSLNYMAPELPRQDAPDEEVTRRPVGKPSDVFSLGVVIAEMALRHNCMLLLKYVRGRVPAPSFIPPVLASLLDGMLRPEPSQRITAMEALQHEFFAGLDWMALEDGFPRLSILAAA